MLSPNLKHSDSESGWGETALNLLQLTPTEGRTHPTPHGLHEVGCRRGLGKEMRMVQSTSGTLWKHYRRWAEGMCEPKEGEGLSNAIFWI